jgi:stage V sporulation protein AC
VRMSKIKQGISEKSEQAVYAQRVKKAEPQQPRLRNALYAFFVGGGVCLLGEAITRVWANTLDISVKEAGDPTVATLIFIASLLTGLGYFDKLARHAGAGLAVPVTGFANAMAASAMEFKREGLVFGIGGRMFQLAGAVIVFGTVTAFFVGIIAALLEMFQ